MAAVRTQGQGLHAHDGSQIEIAVKVWKQRTAAGRFPFQRSPSFALSMRTSSKSLWPDKMLPGGFDDLCGARKMNEAIAAIDFRAAKHSRALSRPPQRRRANFVNDVTVRALQTVRPRL